MTLLTAIQKTKKETHNSSLKLLFPNMNLETKEEVIYRRNGKSVDKVIEFDSKTGSKLKITHYDYFNDKKIRSVDEYDRRSGKRIRTINYVLYKSVDEYDINTGKKVRTINFNIKDDTKISSIQEYDQETGKIVTISIYKRDGKTVSIVKKFDPATGKITNHINNQYSPIKNVSKEKFSTRCYDNIKTMDKKEKDDMARLIDNLYQNNLKFDCIK